MSTNNQPGRLLAPLALLALCTLAHSQSTTPEAGPCDNPVESCDPAVDYFPEKITLEHAVQVKDLVFNNTYVDFTVGGFTPDDNQKHRVVRCGCPPGDVDSDTQILFTEPRRLHVGEAPTVALISVPIPDLDALKYINSVSDIVSPQVRERVEDGRTLQLGVDDSFVPMYGRLQGDTVDASIIGSFEVTNYENATTGKPYLLVAEVLEQTPLGRAEWMKVIGLMLGQTETANLEFERTITTYNDIKRRVGEIRRSPSVFLNFPNPNFTLAGDLDSRYLWTFPGEKQYITEVLRDANVDYRFANNDESTGTQLRFSEVLRDFKSARYIVNSGRFPQSTNTTLDEYILGMGDADETGLDGNFTVLAKQLDAVRCGNVWVNQKRLADDNTANDFFGLAAFRPDLVLRDFAIMMHPTINITEDTFFSYSYGNASEEIMLEECPYNELDGELEEGMRYVDKEFTVVGLNRFEIEDELEDNVLPELRDALELDADSMEVFFPNQSVRDANETQLVVRVLVEDSDAVSFNESSETRDALDRSLGDRAEDITEQSTNIVGGAVPDDGLTAGAIIGIIIGCLLVILIVVAVGVKLWKRKGLSGAEVPQQQFWDESTSAAVGGVSA